MKKVVFITGAGSGFGKECAKVLAKNDFSIFLIDMKKENLKSINNEIILEGENFCYFSAEL